ncbi:MAG: hypothetical protein GY803_25235 [Chloroflexi bacterium]|nr:hypothetical protein [Chloroflexota bacterium]
MDRDFGLDTLLDLDGVIIEQKYGYWVKFDVSITDVSPERPHGIRYSLTLHNKYGQRVMGFDNAHAVQLPRKNKYAGRRVEFDHVHRHEKDKGVSYEFRDAYQLIQDFFESVDSVLAKTGD